MNYCIESIKGGYGRGTGILLPDGGIIPVEEINAGDFVMGKNGETRVVDMISGEDNLYEITLCNRRIAEISYRFGDIMAFCPDEKLKVRQIESLHHTLGDSLQSDDIITVKDFDTDFSSFVISGKCSLYLKTWNYPEIKDCLRAKKKKVSSGKRDEMITLADYIESYEEKKGGDLRSSTMYFKVPVSIFMALPPERRKKYALIFNPLAELGIMKSFAVSILKITPAGRGEYIGLKTEGKGLIYSGLKIEFCTAGTEMKNGSNSVYRR